MKRAIIAYHSGYGHTLKQAEAILEGLDSADIQASLLNIDNVNEEDWEALNQADGIIFGSPTYMGGVSAQFKTFADATSKVWFTLGWKNKLAAGFTNSASINGDKHSTIQYLWTLAMQHGMLWVGTGMTASSNKDAQRNDINYLGGFAGLLAQSPADASAEEGPLPGDLETAKAFGTHFAESLKKFNT